MRVRARALQRARGRKRGIKESGGRVQKNEGALKRKRKREPSEPKEKKRKRGRPQQRAREQNGHIGATHTCIPRRAARSIGRSPPRFATSGSTPYSSNSRVQATLPLQAAAWSGASPRSSALGGNQANKRARAKASKRGAASSKKYSKQKSRPTLNPRLVARAPTQTARVCAVSLEDHNTLAGFSAKVNVLIRYVLYKCVCVCVLVYLAQVVVVVP